MLYTESLKVYPSTHEQRECSAEPYMRRISCVTNKEFPISPRFSPTTFMKMMQIQYSYEHTFVQQQWTLFAEPCVRNCSSREREGLYNGNVQQNPLCAASCH